MKLKHECDKCRNNPDFADICPDRIQYRLARRIIGCAKTIDDAIRLHHADFELELAHNMNKSAYLSHSYEEVVDMWHNDMIDGPLKVSNYVRTRRMIKSIGPYYLSIVLNKN